jgi:two-component system phosphate regulon sensor histidine kinase PhoR
MHRLIDDILELSSIESGNVSLDVKPVNLFALVDEIFTNLSGKARAVQLTNEVAKDTIVFADRARLEQMLTNLIDNAVKFNSENGQVIVRHTRLEEEQEEEDGKAKDVIFVSDTGEGISAEHLQKIFERFYRADRARSREVGGTGLGLAIVKHLARLHDGEVSVESKTGKGTTFSLELPKKKDKG